MKDVRDADEDGLLALTGYLPAEAAEAVLELATGGTPYASKAEPAPIVPCETRSHIPTHSAGSA
jgi:hypothetical protein